MPRDFFKDAVECVEAAITFVLVVALLVACGFAVLAAYRFFSSSAAG